MLAADTIRSLRIRAKAPANAFVHIPQGRLVGVQRRSDNAFEFEPVYELGGERMGEAQMVANGHGCFRVMIDRFTVRDFNL